MSAAYSLLSRLDGVRQSGPGRWLARCPAHDDRGPSLSVREMDDGRVLVHCFAECPIHDVLDALGLAMADLYPHGAHGDYQRERLAWSPRDVLACVADESVIVIMAATALARGEPLSDDRRARLLLAAERMQRAVEIINA